MSITVITKRGRILGYIASYTVAISMVLALPSDWYYPGTTAVFIAAVSLATFLVHQIEKRYPKSVFFDRQGLIAKAQFKAVKELNKQQLERCCECQLRQGKNVVESHWCDVCYTEWQNYNN